MSNIQKAFKAKAKRGLCMAAGGVIEQNSRPLAAPVIQGSALSDAAKHHAHDDHFTCIHPVTDWRSQIAHAEKIGLGNGNYELITVK